jgi:hypothetical protein
MRAPSIGSRALFAAPPATSHSVTLSTEHDCPRCPVLLQVYQQLAEGPGLRMAAETRRSLNSIRVWESKNVEELGARRRARLQPLTEACSMWSKFSGRRMFVGPMSCLQACLEGSGGSGSKAINPSVPILRTTRARC